MLSNVWEIITEIENSHHQSNVTNLYSWINQQLLIQAAGRAHQTDYSYKKTNRESSKSTTI
jgi:hypothetical protein